MRGRLRLGAPVLDIRLRRMFILGGCLVCNFGRRGVSWRVGVYGAGLLAHVHTTHLGCTLAGVLSGKALRH
jgi:hypothetical protein